MLNKPGHKTEPAAIAVAMDFNSVSVAPTTNASATHVSGGHVNSAEQPTTSHEILSQTFTKPTSSSLLNSPPSIPTPSNSSDQDAPLQADTDAEGSIDMEMPDMFDGANDAANYDEPTRATSQTSRGRKSSDADSVSTSSKSLKRKTSSDDDFHIGSKEPRKRNKSGDEDFSRLMEEQPSLFFRRSERTKQPTKPTFHESDSDVPPTRKRQAKAPKQAPARKPVSNVATPSLTDSESDDEYGTAKGRAQTKKARRRLQSGSGNDSPALGEVRFSSRQTNKNVTYNENDTEDEADIEYEGWDETQWDYGPAIDAVLDYRWKDNVNPDDVPDKNSFEYLIKWQDEAHYHATWKDFSELKDLRGVKRLHNYLKLILQELDFLQDPNTTAEDREVKVLERQHHLDVIEDYKIVERVVAKDKGVDGDEYYVKWKSLPYEACTWEKQALIEDLAPAEIQKYNARQKKPNTSAHNGNNMKTREKLSSPIKEQPTYIKHGELRDFQLTGLNFLAANWSKDHNVVLADEMGLGKTIQTIVFLSWLKNARQLNGPFLVIVPLGTLPAWAEAFNNWCPDINYVVYSGNDKSRDIIRSEEFFFNDRSQNQIKFNVLLTTYEYVLKDAKILSEIVWQFLAIDEGHRLKNPESQLYKALLMFTVLNKLIITGTPVQNDLHELSALMDFLNPGKNLVQKNIDLQSDQASQELAKLTESIGPYMIRRTKAKVAKDLPEKKEKILRVELADHQKDYYQNILTRNYEGLQKASNGEHISLTNVVIELKKASNHPYLFPQSPDPDKSRAQELKDVISSSGKLMLLDKLLAKLKAESHRVLIFSQFVGMLDILSRYLTLRNHKHQRLDGTIPTGPRNKAINHFNAPGSEDYCFLLSTRAGGLGINLATADTVILFDSDWNPQMDLQAMARAHRIGQKNPVTIYRLVSKGTIEEDILERARNKLLLEHITIQRSITDKDAAEFTSKLAAEGKSVKAAVEADDISQLLKKRASKMFDSASNQKRLEDLDIDEVINTAEEHSTDQPEGLPDMGEDFMKSFEVTDVKVDNDWEQIIPKEQLERQREEDRKKKAEEAAQASSAIEKTTSKKRKADDLDLRDQRAAKKRARDAALQQDLEDAADSDDPMKPLDERDIRNLIKAYMRFGYFEDEPDAVLKEARLVGRDRALVQSALTDLLETSKALVAEDDARLADIEKDGRAIAKKDRKIIKFNYKGVECPNAHRLCSRGDEMRMLRAYVSQLKNPLDLELAEATKPANYTGTAWPPKKDGMLMVGIARHGFGAWDAISKDKELGLSDSLFLKEKQVNRDAERKQTGEAAKTPGPPHLIRRAEYLMDILKVKTSAGSNVQAIKSLENHHRNNKKQSRTSRYSNSPAPGGVRKSSSHKPDRPRVNGTEHSGRASSAQRPDPRRTSNGQKQRPQREASRERVLLEAMSKGYQRRNSNQGQESSDASKKPRDLLKGINVDSYWERLEKSQTARKASHELGKSDDKHDTSRKPSTERHDSHQAQGPSNGSQASRHLSDANKKGPSTDHPTKSADPCKPEKEIELERLFRHLSTHLKRCKHELKSDAAKGANRSSVIEDIMRRWMSRISPIVEDQRKAKGEDYKSKLLSYIAVHWWPAPHNMTPERFRGAYENILQKFAQRPETESKPSTVSARNGNQQS